MAYIVIYGFWSGASVSLAPVCIGVVCQTEDYGKRNGTAYTLASFGTLIGIPIAGVLVDADDGSYTRLIIFAGCLNIAALIPYALGRGLLTNWKLFTRC